MGPDRGKEGKDLSKKKESGVIYEKRKPSTYGDR